MTNTTNIKVQRSRIIGTTSVVLSAWEPSSYTGPHGTVTTIDGQCYGRIGTLRPSHELQALPAGSEERSRKVRAHYDAEYQRAYAAIIAVHAEAKHGEPDMGQIEVSA